MGEDAVFVGGGCCCVCTITLIIVLACSYNSLGHSEQILIVDTAGRRVVNGPGSEWIPPHVHTEWRKAIQLNAKQHAIVNDVLKGERVLLGPGKFFLGAWEELVAKKNNIVLKRQEYIRLEDKYTGEARVVEGPRSLAPNASEVTGQITKAQVIAQNEGVLVEDMLSGRKELIIKRGVFIPGPYMKIIQKKVRMTNLSPRQYAEIEDGLTGMIRYEEGPQMFWITAYERLKGIYNKPRLLKGEYIVLINQAKGTERVLTGPVTYMTLPEEEPLGNGTQKAIYVDADTAVLVKSKLTGIKRLITKFGPFFPEPYDRVVELVKLTRVLPHEGIVIRDVNGDTEVKLGSMGASGTGGAVGYAFFQEPYTELVTQEWSEYSMPGPDKKQTISQVRFQRVDLRSRKLYFTYVSRSSDSVKLRLSGTIFWKVNNLKSLVENTADPVSDVWSRSRSSLVSAVARKTLSAFMAGANKIAADTFANQKNDTFYIDRGIVLQSMELTGFDILDEKTADILQQIIQETTNRVNKLAKVESENQVNAAILAADITKEESRTELIKTKAANDKLLAQTEGEAEGTKLVSAANTFIGGLQSSVPDVNSRISMYRDHNELKSRMRDADTFVNGNAELFLTPSGMAPDWSLRRLSQEQDPAAGEMKFWT
eukprot:gnl/TRDRNA2_/TRDRNA2_35459_c0_seq1.p1 gnl/TRDRNA2_/TRDRNA2_35459_c0~~gnl/TRDRNA2_/TRDRNA2_35459_c0_seq1.p1  ORF type:complete len:653 (+),score=140.67 gnl/TRDRNA2_/TRDRNA2_35459_c0_seq1:110-2068(+)